MRLPRLASGLALSLLALSAVPVFARCDPATEPDRTDLAVTRDAVLANCDCAGAENHGAYVRCAVDQIVKSIVFREAAAPRHLLFLTAGGNRVDPAKAAALAGAPLEKADAASIRAVTGFAIGGVAPLGHLTPIDAWLDPRLLDFATIWAAAGTPHHVFPVEPAALAAAVGATVADFTA